MATAEIDTITGFISPSMHDGELRILDIDLATRLGFDRPRDIRKLIKRYLADLRQMGRCATVARRPEAGGHAVSEFYLNKKQAIFITAKSETKIATEVTIEIIERFDAYERGEMPHPQIPRTLPEALRLAADQAEQIEVMKPVVAAYNRLAKAQGSVCLTDAAKMCQMKPQAFIRYLNAEHWIYRRVGSPAWIGYAEHLDNGDLEHKYTTVQRDDGTEKITTQARVTAQGVTKLCLKLGIPAPAFDKQEAAHATV